MASTPSSPADDAPDLEALRFAIASGDPTLAMPALTQLRFCTDEEAVPLLVLGSEQDAFLVRSLSCSGHGCSQPMVERAPVGVVSPARNNA